MLRLFDTACGRVVPLELRDPGSVSIYVCGPTVYGPPHLGHGRSTLVFDVLRRYLEWTGLKVDHVANVTDVDDNIIAKAASEGRTETEVAVEWEAVWWKAMDALGVKRPTADPHATAYVERMVEMVGRLVAIGMAYETSDGVYLQAGRVEDYGLLARQSIESLQAGARVEGSDETRAPIDFALWKKAKPGEPSWDSPWGPGRPGWHTECVAMSLDLLGDGFDIHGGGMDLAFPHHENERAQAVALGRPFARCWMHHGFVEVDGEKMSKSLRNFTTLIDLLDSVDPRAYRLLVLRSHYRSPMEVTKVSTADAEGAIQRLDTFARRTADLMGSEEPDPATVARFRERMDDDLDTPGVVDLVFRAVRQANTALDSEDVASAAPLAAAVHEICQAVGLVLEAAGEAIPPAVTELARRRDEARAAQDWAQADALRDQLQLDGWLLEDTPARTVVRRA